MLSGPGAARIATGSRALSDVGAARGADRPQALTKEPAMPEDRIISRRGMKKEDSSLMREYAQTKVGSRGAVCVRASWHLS